MYTKKYLVTRVVLIMTTTSTEAWLAHSTKRHMGIDLGTTNSSICFTSFDPGRKQYSEPTPVKFGDADVIRSLLLLDSSGKHVVASGEDVYINRDYLVHPNRVHEEFKLNLGKQYEAELYTHLLASELFNSLKRTLNVRELDPSENVSNVGVPAEWHQRHPECVEQVKKAVVSAGLPNVSVVAEPVAAMYFHAFMGDIRFEDRPQLWMVLDIGGGTTDLAIVQTQEKGKYPEVLHTYGKNYGGKDFDRLILDKHILPHYWNSTSPPNVEEELAIKRLVRDFKEEFSERIQQGKQYYRTKWPLANIKNPVVLSKDQFHSEEMGLPLIHRFSGILSEGYVRFKISMQDIDRVILTGGSARWYFVQEFVDSIFGREISIISKNPELTISKGLALAQTDFIKYRKEKQRPIPPLRDRKEPDLSKVDKMPKGLSRDGCKKRVRRHYPRYVALAAVTGLVLSPLPGVAQPILSTIEGKMALDIANIYGYDLKKLNPKEISAIVGGILAGGTIAKLIAMEAMTFVPGVGWVIKSAVAGGAIPAMAETIAAYFEKRRFGGENESAL